MVPTPFVTHLHVDIEPLTTTLSAITNSSPTKRPMHQIHISNTETRMPCATAPNTLHVSVWMAAAAPGRELCCDAKDVVLCHQSQVGSSSMASMGPYQGLLEQRNSPSAHPKGPAHPSWTWRQLCGSCVVLVLLLRAARGQGLLCTYTRSHVFCLIGA